MESIYDFEKYEFGIIDDFIKEKEFLSDADSFYNPSKYDCVKLLKVFWMNFYKDVKNIETINVKDNFNKNKGFATSGASLISQTNLVELKKCVEKQMFSKKRAMETIKDATLNVEYDEEFELLLETINKAIKENKYMICYVN